MSCALSLGETVCGASVLTKRTPVKNFATLPKRAFAIVSAFSTQDSQFAALPCCKPIAGMLDWFAIEGQVDLRFDESNDWFSAGLLELINIHTIVRIRTSSRTALLAELDVD